MPTAVVVQPGPGRQPSKLRTRVQIPSTALNILRQIDIKFVNYGDVSSSGAYTYCSARLLGNGTECSDIGEILKR